jgi:hypothetical protein
VHGQAFMLGICSSMPINGPMMEYMAIGRDAKLPTFGTM